MGAVFLDYRLIFKAPSDNGVMLVLRSVGSIECSLHSITPVTLWRYGQQRIYEPATSPTSKLQNGGPMADFPTYEDYRAEWLLEVTSGEPSTSQLGTRFSHKLVTQWLDIDREFTDIHYCDGAGDGGIDIALLWRGESSGSDADAPEGDTWYLIQSKYGSAFAGTTTLLAEGQKVIETIDGRRTTLSSLTTSLVERLSTFRQSASELDRIVLVYATNDPLSDAEREVMKDVRSMGRERLGPLFDVEAVSIETIYRRLLEEGHSPQLLEVQLTAAVTSSGSDLFIGSVTLPNLYAFLKQYRAKTDDLDRLYEKNVRRFLGGRGKVNKRMQQTLLQEPEKFGLYNNGITIVVADLKRRDDNTLDLFEPYIVNGCQTTRTIWEILQTRLDAGGTGSSAALSDWRDRASRGAVVTKIVKVGSEGEALLQDITRFTNSQNAVREKDFLALSSDMRTWAAQLASQYNVFLEIQRGGWDSRKAWQRQHPSEHHFDRWANAFDLLKVYGAGWLGEAGLAFGKNPPFLPGGSVFKRITENPDVTGGFGAEDLYSALQLSEAALGLKFGRGAERQSRRQTRFLFFLIVMDILKDVLVRGAIPSQPRPADLTFALRAVFDDPDDDPREALLGAAIEALDEYMTDGTEDSVFAEPSFKEAFNSDLNAFLKSEQLGKGQSTPRLRSLLAATARTLGRARPGEVSPRDLITKCVQKARVGAINV